VINARWRMTTMALAAMMIVSGCAGHKPGPSTPAKTAASRASAPRPLPEIPVRDRIALPPVTKVAPEKAAEPLYSLHVRDMDIRKALAMFARVYHLNIIPDADIRGNVSVDFHDLSFRQAMEAMLGSLDFAWERDGGLIRIHARETENFSVNYIRLIRSASGSSQASASSGSSGGGEGGSAGTGESGAITITQQDTVRFWDELEKQLHTLVSKDGRLVVNRMAGIVQVTERPSRMRRVRAFLRRLIRSIERQVLIDVRIVEVTLDDSHQLGIDWSRVNPGALAHSVTFTVNNAITQPAGGLTLPPSVMTLNISHLSNRGKGDISSVISALAEQGKVRIISQPKVRTLNNQPAMIKVGVDKTFFRKEQSTTTGTATTTASTDVPQVVTEGIVLTITPQIADDGQIMMDISPVITRISSVTEVKDKNGVVLSSAPNVDIRQASSLVRASDGSTIVLGGLIQTTVSNTERGIPLLKDLPLMGYLFKGVARIKKRTELVIFITPHLVGGEPANEAESARS